MSRGEEALDLPLEGRDLSWERSFCWSSTSATRGAADWA
jgi:hypothetical protein